MYFNTPTSTLGLSVNAESCERQIKLPHGVSWDHPKHLPAPGIITAGTKDVPQLRADLRPGEGEPFMDWVDKEDKPSYNMVLQVM